MSSSDVRHVEDLSGTTDRESRFPVGRQSHHDVALKQRPQAPIVEPGGFDTEGVVLAHDYATQRGGAERVALMLAEAFPGAPMYTTLYHPAGTFPEFAALNLRAGVLNNVPTFRRHHRLALPALAHAVNAQPVSGDVLVASSTGWAHGYRGARRTVVYCHAPARWLYQRDRYLGAHASATVGGRVRRAATGAVLDGLAPWLRSWDRRAATRADVYLANSTVTKQAVKEAYGIEAEVLPPPPALLPAGGERAVPGIAPDFLLCVARLLPYKNVDVIIRAVQELGDFELVVVGDGPDRARLASMADPRIHLLGRVTDEELRWLYGNSAALVAASYEDYGLSPLEAGAFGRPSVVLRDGGYLDTVVEGRTGVFFDSPEPGPIADAIVKTLRTEWERDTLHEHVAGFAAPRFVRRLQEVVEQLR
jgi:glycosyltransferase involved in cell wall biosynthesis